MRQRRLWYCFRARPYSDAMETRDGIAVRAKRHLLARHAAVVQRRAERLDPAMRALLWSAASGLLFVVLNSLMRGLSMALGHPGLISSRETGQRLPLGAKEVREPMYIRTLENFRKYISDESPIFERITGAGWRLGSQPHFRWQRCSL